MTKIILLILKHQCVSSLLLLQLQVELLWATLYKVVYARTPDKSEMIYWRGKSKKSKVLIHKSVFSLWTFSSNLWYLLRCWVIWTFIEIKPCERSTEKIGVWNWILTAHCNTSETKMVGNHLFNRYKYVVGIKACYIIRRWKFKVA